jgi:long-chain acyl-CoA synthetase
LTSLGVKPGTAVGLYLPNTPAHPILFFAVLKCGGRVVHMSPLDAERELAHKLKDSGARIMVTTNFPGMVTRALKLDAEALLDHLIIGDDAEFGPAPIQYDPIPANGRSITLKSFYRPRAAAVRVAGSKRERHRAAAIYRRHHGAAQRRDAAARQSHRRPIYDVWQLGRGAARRATSGEKVILVLPLFHIYALSSVTFLRAIDQGNDHRCISASMSKPVMRDIEVKRAYRRFRACRPCGSRSPIARSREARSFVAGDSQAPAARRCRSRSRKCFEEYQTGISLRGGWGMTETCSPAPAIRLRRSGQARLHRPAAAGHRSSTYRRAGRSDGASFQ